MHIRRWLYGWLMWARAVWIVRHKKHGAGKQPWSYALRTAAATRYLVDGLDLAGDRRDLADTVARLQPRLLVLDPFVRLHRIDENASGEVAPLLAYLREL